MFFDSLSWVNWIVGSATLTTDSRIRKTDDSYVLGKWPQELQWCNDAQQMCGRKDKVICISRFVPRKKLTIWRFFFLWTTWIKLGLRNFSSDKCYQELQEVASILYEFWLRKLDRPTACTHCVGLQDTWPLLRWTRHVWHNLACFLVREKVWQVLHIYVVYIYIFDC